MVVIRDPKGQSERPVHSSSFSSDGFLNEFSPENPIPER